MEGGRELGGRSSRPGSVRPRGFRKQECWLESVGEAEIEQHSFRDFSRQPLRLEIDDEERLPTDESLEILTLFLQSGQDRARVISKRNREANELGGGGNFLRRKNFSEAEIQRLESRKGDERFQRCRTKRAHEGIIRRGLAASAR